MVLFILNTFDNKIVVTCENDNTAERMDQFITPEYLERWKSLVPRAEVATFSSGHFVQEESTKESILKLDQFLHAYQLVKGA